MGYKPFKMLGHELPGIKQRGVPYTAGDPLNEEMVDGVSTTPNKMAAVGSSPAKGWLRNIAKRVVGGAKKIGGAVKGATDKLLGIGGDDAPAEGGGDGSVVPPHGDEAHTGGAIGGEGEAGAEGGVFNVGDAISGMEGLDRAGMKEYMGQFDEDQTRRIKMQQMRNRTKGAMKRMGFGGGGFGGMWSDVRLKENIKRTGESPSGIPIYEFNYIGDNARYSGAMAQDLLDTNSVSMHESGFYMVDYDSIDVDMKLL